jgi:hypothetical protein
MIPIKNEIYWNVMNIVNQPLWNELSFSLHIRLRFVIMSQIPSQVRQQIVDHITELWNPSTI